MATREQAECAVFTLETSSNPAFERVLIDRFPDVVLVERGFVNEGAGPRGGAYITRKDDTLTIGAANGFCAYRVVEDAPDLGAFLRERVGEPEWSTPGWWPAAVLRIIDNPKVVE